ncbi:MAG: sodium:calcium antiporter [Candidatus Bathycorpusculaceae bacterium]
MSKVFDVIMVNILTLAFSLVVLAIASQFTIKSIEQLIELTRLSEASIGFAVLSVMTSIPEIFVGAFSVLHGKPGFSVGDILGSNVFNIGIVVGILATMGFLKKCSTELLTELVDILFLSSIIPLILVVSGTAHFLVGLALLGIFIFSVREMTKKRKHPISLESEEKNNMKVGKKIVLLKIIVGVALVVAMAELIIMSASNISTALGVAPILIGAKVIAIGTSMPELALDLTAVRRGRVHLALGDLIGSNLTNITLVLGIVLLSTPFQVVDLSIFAQIVPFVLITTLILWRYLTKGGVSQFGGVALIITYIVFQAVIVA